MTTVLKREMICGEREYDNDAKRERDSCMNLPRRSPFSSFTDLRALFSEVNWMGILKIVMCDMSERASERAKEFSNMDNLCKRPTPEHAEARQLPLQWAGCRTRCQLRIGNRLQSTSAPNKTRDGIGRKDIPQSNVVNVSGALIGRGRRQILSAPAEKERLPPELEFERLKGIFATVRAAASRAASRAASMAASMATLVLLQFPMNLAVCLHRQENRRLGLLAALPLP